MDTLPDFRVVFCREITLKLLRTFSLCENFVKRWHRPIGFGLAIAPCDGVTSPDVVDIRLCGVPFPRPNKRNRDRNGGCDRRTSRASFYSRMDRAIVLAQEIKKRHLAPRLSFD